MSDTTKPKVQPSLWPDPVDGEELLDSLETVIRDHVILNSHEITVAALWCVQTYCYQHFEYAALLMIDAPEHGCGKTALLKVIGKLVPNPLEASGMTEAVLFRVIADRRPTVLVDELDSFIERHDGFVNVLNGGHQKGAKVMRMDKVGDRQIVQDFETFGCKALAGIDLQAKLPASTLSRCLRIGMRRKLPEEQVKRLRKTDPEVFTRLCARIRRFVADHAELLAAGFEAMPDELEDREQDIQGGSSSVKALEGSTEEEQFH